MDTATEPLVLKIKRAIEASIGIPVRVQQNPDDTFEVALLHNLALDPPTVED